MHCLRFTKLSEDFEIYNDYGPNPYDPKDVDNFCNWSDNTAFADINQEISLIQTVFEVIAAAIGEVVEVHADLAKVYILTNSDISPREIRSLLKNAGALTSDGNSVREYFAEPSNKPLFGSCDKLF